MEQIQPGKIPSSVQDVPARSETFHAARERFNETLANVGEQARHAAQYTDRAVHNNPWTSVGVGFGVGVLIGALIAIAASRGTRAL